jgi:hypothetical protein
MISGFISMWHKSYFGWKAVLVWFLLGVAVETKAQNPVLPPEPGTVSLSNPTASSVFASVRITPLVISPSDPLPEMAEWGFCYATNLATVDALTFDDVRAPNVTYVPSTSALPPQGGTVTATITGLLPGTTYYVVGYARNKASPDIKYSATPAAVTTIASASPSITTGVASSVSSSGARIAGTVVSQGQTAVSARGIELSASSTFASGVTTLSGGSGLGSYEVAATGLAASTTYFFRAYARNASGTSRGSTGSFTTLAPTPTAPTVSNLSVSSITASTVTVSFSVDSAGSAALTARGIEISTSANMANPTRGGTILNLGSQSYQIVNLAANTVYYVRGYATNGASLTGTTPIQSFRSLASVVVPDVTTAQVANPTGLSVTLSGAIAGGDSTVNTRRGFTLSNNSDLSSSRDISSTSVLGSTSFSLTATNLAPGVWYFYRAYTTNSAGTGTGATLAFKTPGTNPSTLAIINGSTRASAGSGSAALITGIVLAGNGSAFFLARGAGPALAAFGVGGTMADPTLVVYGPNSSTRVAGQNDNWDSAVTPLFGYLGAFSLPSGSRDATALLNLGAGAYTIVLSSSSTSTGVALAELYRIK